MEEEEEESGDSKSFDEKVKAQVRLWRIDGVPRRQILERLKERYGITVPAKALIYWKPEKDNVAESLLRQIHLLRQKIDNALILEVPNQKLSQYLNTLETYARVYKEIPKTSSKDSKKGAKELYESLTQK